MKVDEKDTLLDEKSLKVKLPVFEGPLDLLLYLIKKEEVDIYSIPIEKITGAYLEHLEMMREENLEVAGEYIVIAATLLYIKSRTLLPKDQQAMMDDAVDEEDPRWELIRQLLEYKKYKEASEKLFAMGIVQEGVWNRGGKDDLKELGVSDGVKKGRGEPYDLLSAFSKVLERIKARGGNLELEGENFTVGEKIIFIEKEIEGKEYIEFSKLFDEVTSEIEVVVTFLALLELMRLQKVQVRQKESFSEIEISKK